MSGFDIPEPPIDDIDLKSETDKAKQRLTLETAKSKILQNQVYQQMMRGKLPRVLKEGTQQLVQQGVSTEAIDKFKSAFTEGYSMRMFREGFEGPAAAQQQQQQAAPKEERSKFLTEWMNWAQADPDGAKAFIDGLSKEQLDKIAYVDTSKEGGGLALWAAMRGASEGKSKMSEALEIINAMPKPATLLEQIDVQLKLNELTKPPPGPDVNPQLQSLSDKVDALATANAELQKQLVMIEMQKRDDQIAQARDEIRALKEQILTPDKLADAWADHQEKMAKVAESMGYVKPGTVAEQSQDEKDRKFMLDLTDKVTVAAAPILDALADKVKGGASQEAKKVSGAVPGTPGQQFRVAYCEGKMADGTQCNNRIRVPWPIPDDFEQTCPKCNSVLRSPKRAAEVARQQQAAAQAQSQASQQQYSEPTGLGPQVH